MQKIFVTLLCISLGLATAFSCNAMQTQSTHNEPKSLSTQYCESALKWTIGGLISIIVALGTTKFDVFSVNGERTECFKTYPTSSVYCRMDEQTAFNGAMVMSAAKCFEKAGHQFYNAYKFRNNSHKD